MDPIIQCLGISHNTAEVALREKFAFAENGSADLLRRTQKHLALTELVVLSTCNRVEFYFTSTNPSDWMLDRLISSHAGLSMAEIGSSLYRLIDPQVARHLFRVAAGLDSSVLGEPQILGQVSHAYQAALQAGTVGKTLSRLFQGAIHAGKRVRSETDLGRNSTSIPSIAAQMASEQFNSVSDVNVVLLGAGEMAELAIEALRKRGAQNIQVINRSLAGACQLADRWQGEAGTLERLAAALQHADLMITSSSAPHALITREMVAHSMRLRPRRPLTIIDIAFPRDVEPAVDEIPGVRLYDLDALNQDLDEGLNARLREVPKVEAILAQELERFKEYLRSVEAAPLIVQIRDHAEEIRLRELERGLKRLEGLSEEQKAQVSTLTQSLVNKILHHPTTCLRGVAGTGDHELYAEVARELFGLHPEHTSDGSNALEAECPR
ncbi:MAG: glutamyl-tRNA reductase [Anaerolineae bacterium]|nr:MAG: glutamyl-tRNA reductase [Anaerolineae bacterium]